MDYSEETKGKGRERAIWAGITIFLLACLLTVLVSPTVFAQSADETDRAFAIFRQVFTFVQNNYVDEVDADTLLEGALQGLFDSLDDPHSAYLTESDMRAMRDRTTGEFGGVGMVISKQPNENADDPDGGGYVEVVSPIEDTPAFRAGIHAGDVILDVGGESTADLPLDEVVDRIRGVPGTTVTVTIRRAGSAQFRVTLERAIIELPTVKEAMIDDDIAFLRITQFSPYTEERVREAIEFFETEGYESMIIDVRHNPGGLLSSVVDTADFFFSGGVIVGTEGRDPSENRVLRANSGQIVPDSIPIIVLVDEGSASASEILAGALKDRDRATIIGETTYGKGSVQQVRSIGDAGFRLTMSRYYTPDRVFIDETGIEPDRVVQAPELSDAEVEDYAELREANLIGSYVQENPDPDESQINSLVDDLQDQGYELPVRVLRRMVRDELNRYHNRSIVYDLEYDVVLQEAVRMIREGDLVATE